MADLDWTNPSTTVVPGWFFDWIDVGDMEGDVSDFVAERFSGEPEYQWYFFAGMARTMGHQEVE